jgi:hypothetical protein
MRRHRDLRRIFCCGPFNSGGVLMDINGCVVTTDWQDIPKSLLLSYRDRFKNGNGFHHPEVEKVESSGDIETRFLVKNSRFPDSKNRYQYRLKEKTLFPITS